MNKKRFGRGSQAQLQDLYRQAEQGGDLRDADAELQKKFAEDQRFIQELGSFASRSVPANPEIGRASLLTAVARQRNESLRGERRPMIGHVLGARGLCLLAAAGIFAGGAITVGASGGVDRAAGDVQNVLAALHITDRTPNQANTHVDGIDQSGGSAQPPVDAGQPTADAGPGVGGRNCATTPTVTLTVTSTPTVSTMSDDHDAGQAKNGGGECETNGIPTTAPNHQPERIDGTCDKSDTVVKTTPSGVQVDVPCQTPGAGASEDAGTRAPESGHQTPESGQKTPEVGHETTEPGHQTSEATATRELTVTPEGHGDKSGQPSGHSQPSDHQP